VNVLIPPVPTFGKDYSIAEAPRCQARPAPAPVVCHRVKWRKE